jgi:outer membrane protein TolC
MGGKVMIYRLCKTIPFLLLMLASGCNRYDGAAVRREHAQVYPAQLAEKTAKALAANTALDLQDCICLAMEHSLEIKSAELQQRLARLDKSIAFSNFLPAVSLNAQKTYWDPQPQVKFEGVNGFALHDKKVREVSFNVQMPVFHPAAWFLYGMKKRGYEMADLVREHTRQAIAFQVTSQYFQCLSLEQMRIVIEHQLKAAQALATELSAQAQEGLIHDWQAQKARVSVLAKQTESRHLDRSLAQAKADLMVLMGLHPAEAIQLKRGTPSHIPERVVDELITDALLCHPGLAIADRQVALEREKVKAAVANFLPNLTGIVQWQNTSDSMQLISDYWLGGFSAALTVFNGFKNVNHYKAAKALHQEAALQREQATLTLMIQVYRAFDQVNTARDEMRLARDMQAVAQAQLAQGCEQHAQGFLLTSELLRQVLQAEEAQLHVLQADFYTQTSIALLNNVMGKTQTHFEDSTHGTI